MADFRIKWDSVEGMCSEVKNELANVEPIKG